jgi:hypothetical protein
MKAFHRSIPVAAAAALVAALAPATAATSAPAARDGSNAAPAREIRSIHTSEFGVDRPTGVTYAPGRGALLVAGDTKAGGTKLVEVTPGEQGRGTTVLPELADGATAAFDPRQRQLTALDSARQLVVPGSKLAGRPSPADGIDAPAVADPRGSTYSPDGTWHLLDAATASIVSVSPKGKVTRTRVRGLDDPSLEGIAYNRADHLLYVADSAAGQLHAVSGSGRVVRSHDLGDADIADLQSMTFAPSADPTDDPSTQHLYVADAGDEATLGRVAEITLEPAVTVAASSSATLVATRDLSTLSPPSPDPSGIAYLPAKDRLVVGDGEVDEMPIYQNVNLFELDRNGALTGSGATPTWSNEPTGVGYNAANGHLFTTDDDKKSVFEISSAGADGVFGTADDGPRTNFKTSTFGNTDPEGVAFDSQRGQLLLVDGVGSEVFRLAPGPNGRFDGVAPGGDDVATQFDMSQHGAIDPEGIEYDASRDTILVSDGSTEAIYEVDVNGSLMNVIDIAAAGAVNAAGLAMAPATSGGGSNYFVVDRGLDNNSHPGENDGKVYELSAGLAPITNRPPSADAGGDQLIDVPDTATLTGTAVDDGLPAGTLTYGWTMVAGPGTVTFGSANAAVTTATFSMAGSYTLRLTVSDGAMTDFDDMVVTVHEVGSVRTVRLPIVSGADDAMEGGGSTGKFVDLASADIELGHNGAATPVKMLTGLRFANIPVPQGSEIVSAKVQFRVDEIGTAPASYTVRGEAADNAATYLSQNGNISARLSTTATAAWSPPAWGLIGEETVAQQTPELKAILQEIVNRPGWVQGNAAALMIDGPAGTGRRTAEAKDGLTPPVLLLQFKMPVPNVAPVVTAGPDLTVRQPAQATLDGLVTDDGKPVPATTKTWSKVSGPGDVTFGDATLEDTTASFSQPGTYVLRLDASDSQLSAFDEVTVTVQADHAVTLSASPTTVTAGGAVTLRGRVTIGSTGAGVGGQAVGVYVRRGSGAEQLLRTVTTGSDGRFTLSDRPNRRSTYAAAVDGVRSAPVSVTVRSSATAALAAPAVLTGSTTRVAGTIGESAAGQPVHLQRWTGRNWSTVQTATRPAGTNVGYSFTVRENSTGSYHYRVHLPAFADRAAATVPATAGGLQLSVYQADVVRVQPVGDEFVTVRNTGRVTLDVSAWKLRNITTGREYALPAHRVVPGAVLRMHSGSGRTDRNDLYLGRRQLWGPHGVALLRDVRNLRVDRMRY